MKSEAFVFRDAGRRRWPWIKRAAILSAVIFVIGAAAFLHSVAVPADLAPKENFETLKGQLRTLEMKAGQAPKPDPWLKEHLNEISGKQAQRSAKEGKSAVRAGFYPLGDAAARAVWEKHSGVLTHVLVDALQVTSWDGSIEMAELPDEGLPTRDGGPELIAMLSNERNGERISEGVENLAQASRAVRRKFRKEVSAALTKLGASGIAIDWVDLDPGLKPELTSCIGELAAGLKEDGFSVWLCVEMDNDFDCFDFGALSSSVDYFVAKLDDEIGGGPEVGPVASQDWFDGWVKVAAEQCDPSKWLAAIGTYGYDWAPLGPAEKISFSTAMARADSSGAGDLAIGSPTYNGYFSYSDEGVPHTVWFTDATSFLNSHGAVRDAGFAGFVLFSLGSEDPGVWPLIAADAAGSRSREALPSLSQIEPGPGIPSVGRGEIVRLDPARAPGARAVSIAADDRAVATYSEFPKAPTLFRAGDGGQHKVALTFDDGPDPEWTPQILDILRERGVKATFFMVGTKMEENPDLVRQVMEEGHEIGVHTFTHPNLANEPDIRTKLELNATQRLLESLTGRSTSLFRPPFNADSQPGDPQEIRVIGIAQDLGYTTVLEGIDPCDWQEPPAAQLLAKIKAGRTNGSVVLLHDAGGDRSQTVAALPQILDYFEERGDTVVSVADLLGSTRDEIMPRLEAGSRNVTAAASSVGFFSWRAWDRFMHTFIAAASALVVARTLVVLGFAIFKRRPSQTWSGPPPSVSVLIAAFNEEKVIAQTLRSILAQDYAGEIEIIVVDDGSTDETAIRARETAGARARVLIQPNGGKASALQRAIAEAKHGYFIFLDADTQFDKSAIRELMAGFTDPAVGAVSGHARVGNRASFLARCQDLEYICGFNIERRAYDALNCITVVPGAISAFRAEAVRQAGGFSADTLAEDTDLTLALHRCGYRVAYRKEAIAYTEAPETLRALAKQRFRWAFGTLQCAWKHRKMALNPRYKALGLFSLPGIWFFQVILVAFAPLVDVAILEAFLLGSLGAVLPYVIAFIAADLALATVAVKMEGAPLRQAWLIIPQRILFRPLLSFVVWKSLISALRGAWVGWGKLHRTAKVELPCASAS